MRLYASHPLSGSVASANWQLNFSDSNRRRLNTRAACFQAAQKRESDHVARYRLHEGIGERVSETNKNNKKKRAPHILQLHDPSAPVELSRAEAARRQRELLESVWQSWADAHRRNEVCFLAEKLRAHKAKVLFASFEFFFVLFFRAATKCFKNTMRAAIARFSRRLTRTPPASSAT